MSMWKECGYIPLCEKESKKYKTMSAINQSTESADFDKLDGWIVRREWSF